MVMKILRWLYPVGIAVAGGAAGAWLTYLQMSRELRSYSVTERQQLVLARSFTDTLTDRQFFHRFTPASRAVTRAVVHIRVSYGPGMFSLNPLEYRYHAPMRSSGSGVLITDNGYIVTNNHVIEEASRIEVVMYDNARYYAKVIGTDPSTDLALIKIQGENFPFVPFGDSDQLELGEWVLAVGNPFELTSTVTAGIVSAKARNIGVLRDRNNLQIESFIQTDAAVNPGNSGGALVNLKGELVGINTAIATSTGQYAGYSFAIPVSLVQKVVDDLLEFGQVQRGLLGVQIENVDAGIAEEFNLPLHRGVLIRRVNPGSAASAAGLQAGDVIVAVAGHEVGSVSELQERLARYRPGQQINVTYVRSGGRHEVRVRLKNFNNQEKLEKRTLADTITSVMMEDVPPDMRQHYNVQGGVVLNPVKGIWKEAGIPDGFIVQFVDKVPVDGREDFIAMLYYKKGGVLLEGITRDNEKKAYAIRW
jgi:serine protease Do